MERFQGIIGIVLILGIAFLFSNNRSKINYRLVFSGIGLQVLIGFLVFKVPPITWFFQRVGDAMGKLEGFARKGAAFVYGGIGVSQPDGTGLKDYAAGGFVFAFNVTATIILVCVLVAVLYHYGIMQRVVAVIARAIELCNAREWCGSIEQCGQRLRRTGRSTGDDPSLFIKHDQKRNPRLHEWKPGLYCRRHPRGVCEYGIAGWFAYCAFPDHRQPHGRSGGTGDFEDRFPRNRGKRNDGSR
ncbi:Na+ dependent nucleoside transporter N-terminal domain-containing protein [Chitinophaga sp. W2I13]|uniref:Na+ dependent nucleoside transporter N-terminal domain-containing protein n=1 Tax=Chitinophaga sp. W2I13 TaxID=3373923 RepID=UPI003D219198